MRLLIIAFLTMFIGVSAFSQREERMKAMQIAFITEEINLSSEQAEQFWPIYNKGSEESDEIRRQIKQLDKKTADMSEDEASHILADYFKLEQDLLQSRIDMMEELRNVISDKQVLQLVRAKEQFKKEVLKRIKSNRKNRRKGK